MGLPLAQRAGLAARVSRSDVPPPQTGGASYMFCAMYWPLLGGFIAFVIFALIMGWIMDPSRHGDADHDRH